MNEAGFVVATGEIYPMRNGLLWGELCPHCKFFVCGKGYDQAVRNKSSKLICSCKSELKIQLKLF